jgi:hypothetical protein
MKAENLAYSGQWKVLILHHRILRMDHPHTNISAWNGFFSILLALKEEARSLNRYVLW